MSAFVSNLIPALSRIHLYFFLVKFHVHSIFHHAISTFLLLCLVIAPCLYPSHWNLTVVVTTPNLLPTCAHLSSTNSMHVFVKKFRNVSIRVVRPLSFLGAHFNIIHTEQMGDLVARVSFLLFFIVYAYVYQWLRRRAVVIMYLTGYSPLCLHVGALLISCLGRFSVFQLLGNIIWSYDIPRVVPYLWLSTRVALCHMLSCKLFALLAIYLLRSEFWA